MQTADGAHLTDADVTAVGESGVTDWPWASTLERSTYYGHDEVFVYVHNKRDVVSTQWVSDNSRQLLVRDFRQAVVGEIVCHSGVASTNAAAVTRAEMCGPVQDLGAAGGGLWSQGYARADYDRCGGDSGGSVYSLRPYAGGPKRWDVYIVGIHRGPVTPASCGEDSGTFVDIWAALSGAGASSMNEHNARGAFKRQLAWNNAIATGWQTGPELGTYNWQLAEFDSNSWGGSNLGRACTLRASTMGYDFLTHDYLRNHRPDTHNLAWSSHINKRIEDAYVISLLRGANWSERDAWRAVVTDGTATDAERESRWYQVAWSIAASQESFDRNWTPNPDSGQPAKCAMDLGQSSFDHN